MRAKMQRLGQLSNGSVGLNRLRWETKESQRHSSSIRLCGWSIIADQAQRTIDPFKPPTAKPPNLQTEAAKRRSTSASDYVDFTSISSGSFHLRNLMELTYTSALRHFLVRCTHCNRSIKVSIPDTTAQRSLRSWRS